MIKPLLPQAQSTSVLANMFLLLCVIIFKHKEELDNKICLYSSGASFSLHFIKTSREGKENNSKTAQLGHSIREYLLHILPTHWRIFWMEITKCLRNHKQAERKLLAELSAPSLFLVHKGQLGKWAWESEEIMKQKLVFSVHVKKSDFSQTVMVHAFNLSTWEEGRRSQCLQTQPDPQSKIQDSQGYREQSCIDPLHSRKNKKEEIWYLLLN